MNQTFTGFDVFDVEPTFTDLAAIVGEEDVIAAEVAVVDAECRLAISSDEVAIKAHRRAVRRLRIVMRTAVETSTNRATSTAPTFVVGSPFSTAHRVAIRPATRTA